MLARVLVVVGLLASPVADVDTAPIAEPAAVVSLAGAATTLPAPDEPPPPTINEFIPEDRSIGDCISALPKPGCGSEARGGWRQGLILIAIVGGLAFIGWRVVRSARRARAGDESPTSA